MLKQYFLDIMRKGCNGLYLCEVPTGIGKSYQAAHAMEEYVKEIREEYAKAMRQCARECLKNKSCTKHIFPRPFS